jgi:hypothetical protein
MSLPDIYLTVYNVVQGIGWWGVFMGIVMALLQGAPLQAAFQFGAEPACELLLCCCTPATQLECLLSLTQLHLLHPTLLLPSCRLAAVRSMP